MEGLRGRRSPAEPRLGRVGPRRDRLLEKMRCGEPRLRAANPPRGGSATGGIAGAGGCSSERSRAWACPRRRADPRRGLRQRAQHGRARAPRQRHGRRALRRERRAGARARTSARSCEGSVMEMPFAPGSFDLAVCLDVIEHLQDDRGALRELRRVLAPGGALLVTVPAYQWLWSGHDEINHHHRRYNRAHAAGRPPRAAGWELRVRELLQLAAAAGRDRAARARAPATPKRPNRASTCGCRRRR